MKRRKGANPGASFPSDGRLGPLWAFANSIPSTSAVERVYEPRTSHELLDAIGNTAIEAVAITASRRARTGKAKTSVCVLPFVNMSGDPEQEYFSDGITEDIITDLSKVSAL